MKVILKQDVKGLGKRGDTVNVAEGYARNFLLPRGLALAASEGALRGLQAEQKVVQAKEDKVVREARYLAQKLHGKAVTLRARVGEGGKLFGSVTAKDVAEALSKLAGSEIDRKRVELKEAIKSLGEYPVTVRLGHEVVAQVTVQVVQA